MYFLLHSLQGCPLEFHNLLLFLKLLNQPQTLCHLFQVGFNKRECAKNENKKIAK